MTEDEKTSEAPAYVWWIPIWEFIVHAVVGTILFSLIAFPAIALNLLTDYLQSILSLSRFVVWTLYAIEYLLLASGLLLFFVHIIRSSKRTIRLL